MQLLADMTHLIKNVDITIDKFCLTEKRSSQSQFCYTSQKLNCTSSAMLSAGEMRYTGNLQRSCTTAD